MLQVYHTLPKTTMHRIYYLFIYMLLITASLFIDTLRNALYFTYIFIHKSESERVEYPDFGLQSDNLPLSDLFVMYERFIGTYEKPEKTGISFQIRTKRF